MSGDDPGAPFAVGSETAVAVEAELAKLTPAELAAAVRDAVGQYADLEVTDDRVAALCTLATGFLRTGPLVAMFPDEAKDAVVAGFVRAFATAPPADEPYGLVRGQVAAAFHQRELAAPHASALDVLHRTAVGLLAAKRLAAAEATQLAMADWITSVYLAGSTSW